MEDCNIILIPIANRPIKVVFENQNHMIFDNTSELTISRPATEHEIQSLIKLVDEVKVGTYSIMTDGRTIYFAERKED